MKSISLMFLAALFCLSGCENTLFPTQEKPDCALVKKSPDPENEDAALAVPEDSLIAFTQSCIAGRFGKAYWAEGTHDNYVSLCAGKLGLSPTRVSVMRGAAHMPDVFQSGFDNFYNQQWSHAYILIRAFWGPQWVWGDADDDFHDNIDGETGEPESPEGYNGKWAGYYYKAGKQALGDWYVGYACHYIEDVCFCLHASVPDVDMAVHHFDFEAWIQNNWNTGHCFALAAENIPASAYYSVIDLKKAVEEAALMANCSFSSNARLAWEFYKLSGFPTASGAGNPVAAYFTRKMVEEAAKWTGGAIRYALTRYGQW